MVKPATLSACMMVRNEDEFLPGCLESIRFLVDEIIIIDTRLPEDPPDRTKELAEQYGAKVFDYPWEDHFANHRNQSFKHATSDWLFVIDADEKLRNPNHFGEKLVPEVFKTYLAMMPADIDLLAVNCYDIKKGKVWGTYVHPRFVRNNGIIRWINKRHNKLKGYRYTASTDIDIEHRGYGLSEERMNAKLQGIRKSMLEMIKEEPGNPHLYYHLAIAYRGLGKPNAFYQTGRKAIDLYERHYGRHGEDVEEALRMFGNLYYYMGVECLQRKQEAVGINLIETGLLLMPKDIDLHVGLAQAGWLTEDMEMVKAACAGYFEYLPRYRERPDEFGNKATYGATEEKEELMAHWQKEALEELEIAAG